MNETLIPKAVSELKQLILNPGPADVEGSTALDKKIAINVKLEKHSTKREDELYSVMSLLTNLAEFKGQDVSLLISYINRSNFDDEKLLEALLDFLATNEGKDLKIYQKVELVKFLLSKTPENVPIDLINVGLAQLKESDRWLFVSLLNQKSREGAFNLINYYIHDEKLDKSAFLNIFMDWVSNPDTVFLQKVYKKLLPVIKDDNFVKIMKYKLSADQILTIEKEDEKVNDILGQLNKSKNPEFIPRADILQFVRERENNRPVSRMERAPFRGNKLKEVVHHRFRKRSSSKTANNYDRETLEINGKSQSHAQTSYSASKTKCPETAGIFGI
jgi:hypothetical protein